MAKYWKPSIVLPEEAREAIRQLARDRKMEVQDLMRGAVLGLLDQPDGPKQPAEKEVLADLLTSIQPIHEMSTQTADALQKVVESLSKKVKHGGRKRG